MIDGSTILRVVRPTANLAAVRRFYVDVLGLSEVYSFLDKDGFDGLIVGAPGAGYHLAFTRQHTNPEPPRPGPENQLVFYLPIHEKWSKVVSAMEAAGFPRVLPSNPYWNANGACFEDPDGYRVILQNARP